MANAAPESESRPLLGLPMTVRSNSTLSAGHKTNVPAGLTGWHAYIMWSCWTRSSRLARTRSSRLARRPHNGWREGANALSTEDRSLAADWLHGLVMRTPGLGRDEPDPGTAARRLTGAAGQDRRGAVPADAGSGLSARPRVLAHADAGYQRPDDSVSGTDRVGGGCDNVRPTGHRRPDRAFRVGVADPRADHRELSAGPEDDRAGRNDRAGIRRFSPPPDLA
jgi:hypothetical protein